jgi:hypothetical protein
MALFERWTYRKAIAIATEELVAKSWPNAGVKKAKERPIIQVVLSSGKPSILRFSTIEDRESFLSVLMPLKELASKAPPAPAGQAGLLPSKEVQEAVFKAHPYLRDLHQRCAA